MKKIEIKNQKGVKNPKKRGDRRVQTKSNTIHSYFTKMRYFGRRDPKIDPKLDFVSTSGGSSLRQFRLLPKSEPGRRNNNNSYSNHNNNSNYNSHGGSRNQSYQGNSSSYNSSADDKKKSLWINKKKEVETKGPTNVGIFLNRTQLIF
jgi:hypothetical protein